MTLNFPDSPSTGDTYTDSTSGFSYEWNGTVWISTDPQRAAHIKELDDISSGFNGSTTQFNLRVSSVAVEPVSDAQLLISVGGVMQNPTNDYTVSGSTITFTTAPSAGLTFFGVFLGQALSLNTVQDGTVTNTSFKAGTNGIGIQSGGTAIGVGITQLNFIGTGNTFVAIGNTVNVSVNVGGIDTTATSYFNNITASGNLNVTGDLVYDEERVVNSIVSGTSTITNSNATQLLVSAGSTFNGDVDLGNATSDTITATGRFDSDIVPSTDNARDLGASGLEFKDLYIDGTANIDALAADSAAIGDLTSGRVTYAGSSGELQDNAGLTFDGTTLAATRLAAPVAFTTSLTAANVDVTGITTIRDDLTLKGASANITFDKSTDDLIWQDNAKGIFGTGLDLSIYHNGTDSVIDNGTGDLYVQGDDQVIIKSVGTTEIRKHSGDEVMIKCTPDGSVDLYNNNSKKFETTSVGVNITGNVDCDSLNNAGISTFTGDTTFGADVTFGGASSATALVWDKSVDDLIFADGAKAVFGTSSDGVEIFHDGSNSRIKDTGTGALKLSGSEIAFENAATNETMAQFSENGGVSLRYDNTERFQTKGDGINVTGNVDCDSLNNAGISTFTGDATFNGGAGAITIAAASDIQFTTGTWTGSAVKIQHHSDKLYICGGTDGIKFREGATDRWTIDGSGHFVPDTDSTYNIGENAKRVSNVYADTLYGDGSNLTGVGGTIAPLFYNPVAYGEANIDTGIGISFSTAVKAGSGSINVRQVSLGGTVIQSFAIGSSVRFSTSSIEMDMINNLANDSVIAVELPANVITDMSGNGNVAIGWTFRTTPTAYQVWMWGANEYGALGLNQPDNVKLSSPTQLPGSNWELSGSGGIQGFALLKTDGTLWRSGRGNYGNIGDNNDKHRSSPTQIPGTNWGKGVVGLYNFTVAAKTDGTLWSWGNAGYAMGLNGPVGNGKSSPTQIPGTNWSTSRAACGQGSGHTRWIKTDGTLWAWGTNEYGQLGDNSKTHRSSPRQIGSSTNWVHTNREGIFSSFAVNTSGELYAWGKNGDGQLGLNNKTEQQNPTQVPGTNWSRVSARQYGTLGSKTDGTLWFWGNGTSGRGGQNNTNGYSSPRQIPGTTWNHTKIAMLSNSTICLKTDGSLWGWGLNNRGILAEDSGNPGSQKDDAGAFSSPIQIISDKTDWTDYQQSWSGYGLSFGLITDTTP